MSWDNDGVGLHLLNHCPPLALFSNLNLMWVPGRWIWGHQSPVFASILNLLCLHHYEVCMVYVCACVHIVSVMCIHKRKCMVYMHVSSCRNLCLSVHIWRPEVALGYLSLVLSTLVWRQCLIEPGAHAVADWLAKQPLQLSCLCLLA